MLHFLSLFSFIALIFTLSVVGSAAADDHRHHDTETTTRTVALETVTQTNTKTTTTTSVLDRTATRDVTVDHTTTQTVFVTGSGNGGVSASLAKCNASTLYVTLSASSSSTSPTHVSTTTSVSTSTPSSACKSASTVTTTLTKSNSTICPTLPASTITSIITHIQSGTTTCPTVPPSTLTITSVSTSVTTVTTTTTATATASPTCPQLVLNPSFETDSLTPWINDFDNPGVTVTVVAGSTIPGGAHSGSFAAAFTTNPNGPFLPGTPSDFYQSIAIPPLCSSTQQYAFQAFVKTVGNTCYVNAYDNGSGAPFIDIMLTPGGAEPQWVELTAVVTVGTGSFDLVLETACDTMDAVWIDDVTLTPI